VGVIFDRADGFPDRSCTAGGSTNKVAVRHPDGTMGWYLHMKRGSVTPKGVGDTVVAGELLGVVGSSGNSSLPHLHFDLRDSNWNTFDPYQGACNGLVGGSRWADQRGYFDPAINAVRTHSAPPEFPPCPQQEIPHFQDRFDRGDTVHFGIYHRDLLFGQDVDYSVRRPDGSTALAGTYSSLVPHYAAAYALPSYELPARATVGVWRIVVDYDGRRYERPFEVHSRPRSRRVSGPPR